MSKSGPKFGVETTLSMIIQSAILIVGMHKMDFRPKDVMFYLDLVKDAVQKGLTNKTIEIQFIQVQRWLQKYYDSGWLGCKKRERIATFRLQASGIRGLLQSLIPEHQLIDVNEALFLQHILDTYGVQFSARLSVKGGSQKMDPLNSWLREILKPGYIFKKQIEMLNGVIMQHEHRSRNSLKLQDYCNSSLNEGKNTKEIAAQMPDEFSYQLSHQKKFRELLAELPEAIADMEIKRGFKMRHQRFYTPCLNYLKMQRQFYQGLLEGGDS